MKRIGWLLLLSSMLMLQSCFEIIEQVFVKNDGSGNFQLVLNLSKSKTRLNSMIKMKTVNGRKVPTREDVRKEIADIEKTVKNTPGLTNVKTAVDLDNYIASISCDFSKIEDINTGVSRINQKEKNNKPLGKTYAYDAAANSFSRLNTFMMKEEYQKMSNADKEIFTNANYTSIFRFEKTVTGFSNKESKLSANKKAVMLKLSALDVITNKRPIENNIKLLK